MDVAASAFAVVSLAIQLIETGEKISRFLTSVQDAPNEVVSLAQTLDQLNGTLNQVRHLLEQQYLVLRLPGSPVHIMNALKNCEKRISTLDDIIQKAKTNMDHRSRLHRSWAAVKLVSKKEDIREIQSQLRDAETGLQTAMMSNQWQLQMHSINVLSSSVLGARTVQNNSKTELVDSVSRYERPQDQCMIPTGTFRTTTKAKYYVWYSGFFGRVDIQSKSTTLSRPDTLRCEDKATSTQNIVRITPMLLHKTFELRFGNSFGQISRTLSTYPILEDDAPILRVCFEGDLQGLQVLLSSGTVSPFALDQHGRSLLHCAAFWTRPEVCDFLLGIGLDLNHTSNYGNKAIHSVNRVSSQREARTSVDTLRLLTRSPSDISSCDLYDFWSEYNGSVEGAEFMFMQGLIQSEFDISDGEKVYPFLAVVLRQYGDKPSEWESLLRLLLRKRVDLHSPVSRFGVVGGINEKLDLAFPYAILKYGTPLDELFWSTETPFEGEAAADRWLRLLSSEGYDVRAYLEKESALHTEQMQLTFLFDPDADCPRQLQFHWESSSPSVSWDWWVNPKSSTHLVREEFKHVAIMDKDSRFLGEGWDHVWPLSYPVWSDIGWIHEYHDLVARSQQELYDLAQRRANRRQEKKASKAARAQGLKQRHPMPGAWPV